MKRKLRLRTLDGSPPTTDTAIIDARCRVKQFLARVRAGTLRPDQAEPELRRLLALEERAGVHQ